MPRANDDGNDTIDDSPFAPEDEYFLEIESRFSELRNTPFVFSARDWALMKAWHDEAIPLSLVLEAIESCFETWSQAPRRKTISSLAYCRHAVRDLWNERRSLHVGSAEESREQDAAAELARLRDELQQSIEAIDHPALRTILEQTRDQLGTIRENDSVPRVEARLLELEEQMIGDLERALPESLLKGIVSSIDGELQHHRFRDEETRARTRKANLRRALRRELSIPRLSLFG